MLSEAAGSTWPDVKYCYDCLYEAAIKSVERTNLLTTTQSITTVANQTDYNFEPDFLKLYLTDIRNNFYIKYSDGTTTYFIYQQDYSEIVLANNTTSVSIPSTFAIVDAAAPSRMTGTTTSTGALTHSYTIFGSTLGESTLTDSGGSFGTVSVGDIVHNTTDTSHGIVAAESSSTAFICALFDGTNNYFTSGDSYIVTLQNRYKLVLDPPPSTAGHTITIYYVQRPNPVYSYYRAYKMPYDFREPLLSYAAWKYRYRDREPNFGDGYFKYWDISVRELGRMHNKSTLQRDFKVNLIKRINRSRTVG